MEELEKAVESMQKEVQKITELEEDVKEMKKQLEKLDVMEKQMGKLDILELLQKRLMGEERRSWVTEAQNLETTANPTDVIQRLFTPGAAPTTVQMQTQNETTESKEPLMRKIEIPLFDGENAEAWVQRVEQYFEMEDFTEEEKLKAVQMCFDGEAISLYRLKRDRNPFTSWEQVKERVLENFSVAHDVCAGDRLLLLRQDESTGKYCKDFIALASNAPEVTERMLELAFMIGLRPKIQAGVKMFEPRGLQQMMSLSRKVEEWSEESSPKTSWGCGGRTTWLGGERMVILGGQQTQGSQTNIRGGSQTKPNESRRLPYRRLTDAEANERRVKGLCFRCDERFHAGHQCRLKELQVMVVSEEIGDGKCFYDVDEEATYVVTGEVAECHVLSLGSAAGISSPRTMKLRGTIRNLRVTILIDSRASHNFLSHAMVHQLGITPRGTQEYGARMGTGITIHGTRIYQKVALELPDYTLWLETLGEMRVNWKEQVMKFLVNEELVMVLGDHSLTNTAVSLKALWRILRQEGEVLLVECSKLQGREEEKVVTCPAEFSRLMEEYVGVFVEPKGLPSSRGKK
ncbi:PREDICTED: uncharacterized protein LOC104772583 [Camelina sativa]|uniref:Uncharacterized protein LOC104772583 n=1 Tax=Camelina sativa TaxID=90675 RepID=A0ABM0Y4S3_CAMSA|nr:PREDICTED: uncharacterized protein LOC104772583 [Camelina sativa]